MDKEIQMKFFLMMSMIVASINPVLVFAQNHPASFAGEYNLTVSKNGPVSSEDIDNMKNQLNRKARNSCQFQGVLGHLEELGNQTMVNFPEVYSEDPLCEWRGSCYLPERNELKSKFRCSFQANDKF